MRWLIGLALVLAILFAAFAFTVEYVLGTDIPRQQVLDNLRKETGLRIEAGALSTTWGGDTHLKDLTISLPLDDEPLAVVPSMQVNHTGVLGLLAGGGAIAIDQITIDGATVIVRQRADGSWNVQDLIELLQKESDADEPGDLPALTIRDTTVKVISAGGETVTLAPVEATGSPTGGAGYEIDATLPPHLKVAGAFTTRGDFRHRFTITGMRIAELVRPFADGAELPEPIAFEAEWSGQVADGGVSGRLALKRGAAGPYSANGVMEVATAEQALALRPRNFNVVDSERQIEAALLGGEVTVDTNQAAARDLLVQALDTKAQLNGTWSLVRQTGDVTASWTGRVPEPHITHTGHLSAALSRAAPDRQQLTAKISSNGDTPWGRWEAALSGSADGASWRDMSWQVQAPTVRWQPEDGGAMAIAGLTAYGEIEGDTVRLENLSLPPGERGSVMADGTYHMQQQKWQVQMTATDWQPPGDAAAKTPPIDLTVRASGTHAAVNIEHLRAQAADARLEGSATYAPAATPALKANLSAVWPLTQLEEEQKLQLVADLPPPSEPAPPPEAPAAAVTAGDEPPAAEPPLFRALFAWTGQLQGSVSPLDLTATGELEARRLIANHQELEPIRAPMRLALAGNELSGETTKFKLLNGSAIVGGNYILGAETGQVRVQLNEASIDELATIARPDEALDLKGTLYTDVTVRVQPEEREPVEVSGAWRVDQFAAGPVAVAAGSGRLRTTGRWLRLDEIQLQQDGGSARGTAWYDLQEGRDVRAEFNVAQWPVTFTEQQTSLLVTADTQLNGNLQTRHFTGSMQAQSKVSVRGEPVGNLNVSATLLDESLRVDLFETDVLGGSVKGEAHLVLGDKWPQSTGRFLWEEVQPARLEPWTPFATELRGQINGTLAFGPAEDARAHEPLRFTATLDSEQLQVRQLLLDDAYFNGYAGRDRILLDESNIKLADGVVELWVSATRHDNGWSNHVQAEFENLNLDVLNRAFIEEGEEMPGLIDGRMTFVGPVGDLTTIVGQGTVNIDESDLIKSDIIGAVFRTVGFSGDQKDPRGRGSVNFRFESGNLVLDQFQYFNRGIDVYLDGRIEDVWQGKQAPINILAVGTLRPLKDVKLPGAGEIDRLLKGFQSTLTTLRATGTVEAPIIEQVNISEIGSSMLRAIFNDQQEQQR